MTDEEFLFLFESAALPKREWNHAAHLRMAYLYLKEAESWESVLPMVRERIRGFNAAHRNYSGYHETITAAFLRLIDNRMHGPGRGEFTSFDAFSLHNPDLCDGLSILLHHYEKATLISPEARVGFLAPDREPLP